RSPPRGRGGGRERHACGARRADRAGGERHARRRARRAPPRGPSVHAPHPATQPDHRRRRPRRGAPRAGRRRAEPWPPRAARPRAYRITAHIPGSADKPNLVFTSDPPLEQAVILSVLLFGKPARELGRGQSLALQQQALQIATGYVVPELRTSVMNVLGLDTLEVAFPDRTEAPGQVRVGRYVAQDVLISLGQEFGSRVAQVVGIEYAVGANVSVR